MKTEHDYVLQRIEQRERKGVSTHILVFHELPISVEVLSTLIPELKKRGYEFVTLRDYMKTVVPARNWSHLDRTHTSNRRESVQSHHPRPLLTRRGV